MEGRLRIDKELLSLETRGGAQWHSTCLAKHQALGSIHRKEKNSDTAPLPEVGSFILLSPHPPYTVYLLKKPGSCPQGF